MSVQVADDGPVRVVTIDRPEVRGALDRPAAEALATAFRELDGGAAGLASGEAAAGRAACFAGGAGRHGEPG